MWDAYLGDLRTTGWLIAGAGAVLAAAAASLIRPLEVEARLRAAWRTLIFNFTSASRYGNIIRSFPPSFPLHASQLAERQGSGIANDLAADGSFRLQRGLRKRRSRKVESISGTGSWRYDCFQRSSHDHLSV